MVAGEEDTAVEPLFRNNPNRGNDMTEPDRTDRDPKAAVTKSVDAEPGKTDDRPTSTTGIPKPEAFDLDEFKSTHSDGMPGVDIKPAALDILRVGEVGDYFRASSDEDKHWSHPLCFVPVPGRGVRSGTLH